MLVCRQCPNPLRDYPSPCSCRPFVAWPFNFPYGLRWGVDICIPSCVFLWLAGQECPREHRPGVTCRQRSSLQAVTAWPWQQLEKVQAETRRAHVGECHPIEGGHFHFSCRTLRARPHQLRIGNRHGETWPGEFRTKSPLLYKLIILDTVTLHWSFTDQVISRRIVSTFTFSSYHSGPFQAFHYDHRWWTKIAKSSLAIVGLCQLSSDHHGSFSTVVLLAFQIFHL